MSNHPKPVPPGQRFAPSSPKRKKSGEVFVVLAVVLLAGLGIWRWKAQQADAPIPAAAPVEATPASSPPSEANTAKVVAAAKPDFEKLAGRWQRPDGGYVIDIKGVSEDGALDAGYFNPRPIHVAKAQASRDGDLTKVFIELRDVNYPGSTYTLQYNPQNDQLSGSYFQAVQQQNFEVVFVRMP